ncbi:hypothetical protein A2U01_0093955, partial [Trifolium medium]|nr:hypothetical protein [Trifolium medium]
NQEDEVVVEE